MEKKEFSDEVLRKKLKPEEFNVLRKHGTEPPFTGTLLHNKEDGVYSCKVCGNIIFNSKTKFDSGSGWPSFYDAIPGSVVIKMDFNFDMIRKEVRCSNCNSHLGHVFSDGPHPTGKRYCINSISLNFKKSK